MSELSTHPTPACGCSPYPGPAEGESCKACSPNMAVTCEEVDILSRMREIKHEVRAVAGKLKDVRKHMGESFAEPKTGSDGAEWHELSGQLEDLRSRWKEWEYRLQDAIERKLILLGHREPRE
jgi:hypothetical protein